MNESDDRRSGLRTFFVTLPTGEQLLFADIVVEGETLCRLPGEFLGPLRQMIQEVERQFPALTGKHEGVVGKAETTRIGGDPSKARLN